MAWRKAPQSLVAYFDKIVPQDARIERRKMFGYPAAFINGNLFASLFQESCILRLRENDRDEMRVAFGARNFEPMAGRAMREYIVVPDEVLADADAMSEWMTRAMDYGATLAPKAKAKAGKKTSGKAGPTAGKQAAATSSASAKKAAPAAKKVSRGSSSLKKATKRRNRALEIRSVIIR